MTLQDVIDAPPWCVALAEETGPDLILAFASIGHDATRPPSPEFVASSRAQGHRALFFMDASRSWGLDPAFPAILHRALAAAGPAQRRLAIGSSMGAAMALRAAAHVPLDAILAFGPQSHLADPRWQHWTARLADPGPPPLTPGPWTILLHALDDDRDQAMGFPQQPGTDHLLFPGLTHSRLGPHLKERGLLTGLIDAALARDRRRLLRLAINAGGVRRDKGMPG
ncbi:hypothetical protein C0V75_01705 [Tabrizicola sp. TH137]|uniref:hypothetical protein n=1 Tax=Tabrizicola sp. TH137 TaxID=2067452 RepID=UPI000C7D45A3|nr:hypothetical protein [Tabrizicola sp. TH137]PLL14189.1 hypothetical protein C0V75_01705 [Tabrizicola sp. TH137]